MKSLKTLVKLHQKQLDDILAKIGAAEKQKVETEEALRKMLQEAKRELESYNGTEYAFMLEQYLNYTRNQEKVYIKQISDLENKIEVLRTDLFNEFVELKKLELILKKRLQAKKDAENKAESKALDEMTILRHKNV